eukprot:m.235624 g.235624  ORF g.235624 m.235624 type:complete len:620 (+) comp17406_c0_seq1:51-1910(+)
MSRAGDTAGVQQNYFRKLLNLSNAGPSSVQCLQVLAAQAALEAAKQSWSFLTQLSDGMLICVLEQAIRQRDVGAAADLLTYDNGRYLHAIIATSSRWEVSTCIEVLHHLDWVQHDVNEPKLTLKDDADPALSSSSQVGLVSRLEQLCQSKSVSWSDEQVIGLCWLFWDLRWLQCCQYLIGKVTDPMTQTTHEYPFCFLHLDILIENDQMAPAERAIATLNGTFTEAQWEHSVCLALQAGLLAKRSQPKAAWELASEAVNGLQTGMPVEGLVTVLWTATNIAVSHKLLDLASQLSDQFTRVVVDAYGVGSLQHSHALRARGYVLTTIDLLDEACVVLRQAEDILKSLVPSHSLLQCMLHQDLAYALYVREYSTGRFDEALTVSAAAMAAALRVHSPSHPTALCIGRVYALVLEELALIEAHQAGHPQTPDPDKLKQAEMLHQVGLQATRQRFDEHSLIVAKYYGNLGRLYQSCHNTDKAIENHRKALSIKKDLLGEDHFEYGLSCGHLASVLAFDVSLDKACREAIELYTKSIDIFLAQYGDTYSGLQFDYRGLIQCYTILQDASSYRTALRTYEEYEAKRSRELEARANEQSHRFVSEAREEVDATGLIHDLQQLMLLQ